MKKLLTIVAIVVALVAPVSAEAADVTVTKLPVNLTWQKNIEWDILGYAAFSAPVSTGPWTKISGDELIPHPADEQITNVSWAYSDLSDNDILYFALIAVDCFGNVSVYSTPSNRIIIDTVKPPVVEGVEIYANSCTGEIRVLWQASTDSIFHEFVVLVDSVEEYRGTALEYTFTRTDDGTYLIQVMQEDEGCILSDAVDKYATIAVDEDPPSAPTGLVVTGS